jgi:hypothetical protein
LLASEWEVKVDARTNAGDATESLDAALCSGYIDTPTSNRLDRLEERGHEQLYSNARMII